MGCRIKRIHRIIKLFPVDYFFSPVIFSFIILLESLPHHLPGQEISRDVNVDLLVNQAGYMPLASKICLIKGHKEDNYEVVSLHDQKVFFTGAFQPGGKDFGEYSTGDFSGVTTEGYYYIRSGNRRSYPFRISTLVYHPAIGLILNYFSRQRCGSSTTGYLSPCHLDDGVRLDNGKHQDVTGGWHDATDLRKWVGATIYGVIGLSKTFELLESGDHRREKILEELVWGNQYFLKMQEPEGYVMNFVGGDIPHPLAGGRWITDNRWTDNVIGKDGGEIQLVKPNAGKSDWDILMFGSWDDRIIQTDPLEATGQYHFITAEAMMARIMKTEDTKYSEKCLEAAKHCFNWCVNQGWEKNPGTLGASIQASLELFKTTGENSYKDYAVQQAEHLAVLQEVNREKGMGGFFYTSSASREPYKNIWQGCLELISICDLIHFFPDHPRVLRWKEMINRYVSNYFLYLSQYNSFGIVPYGLFTGGDPGGNRKEGNYWYRYFMQPGPEWWVGINSNLASAGVGLLKASQILDRPELSAAAQRQLDWILGNNPFNSSTLIGIGYNHPPHYTDAVQAFNPATPVIPGAVMNGLGGDQNDQPDIGSGNYNISEYWTPMVVYTLWLLAEISKQE